MSAADFGTFLVGLACFLLICWLVLECWKLKPAKPTSEEIEQDTARVDAAVRASRPMGLEAGVPGVQRAAREVRRVKAGSAQ